MTIKGHLQVSFSPLDGFWLQKLSSLGENLAFSWDKSPKSTPLGESALFELSRVKIDQGSDLQRCFEKQIQIKIFLPIFTKGPRGRIYTKFGTDVGLLI